MKIYTNLRLRPVPQSREDYAGADEDEALLYEICIPLHSPVGAT